MGDKQFGEQAPNGIIKGGQIVDVTLIASECVDTRIRGELVGLMFKLDFEKDFDHVNWKYFFSILSQMVFGDRWLS